MHIAAAIRRRTAASSEEEIETVDHHVINQFWSFIGLRKLNTDMALFYHFHYVFNSDIPMNHLLLITSMLCTVDTLVM
jgi:hypothetical protein